MFKLGRKGRVTKVYVASCNECEGEDYVSSDSPKFVRNHAKSKFIEAGWANESGIWYHVKCLLGKKNGNTK